MLVKKLEEIPNGSISCHYSSHSEQHLSYWEALSAWKKNRVLLNVCCHCWPSVIRSDFNTLFSLIDFSLPQTVLNEILFFFFFLHQRQLPNNERLMSQCIRRNAVFETWVWAICQQLPEFGCKRHACVHNRMCSRHMLSCSQVTHLL